MGADFAARVCGGQGRRCEGTARGNSDSAAYFDACDDVYAGDYSHGRADAGDDGDANSNSDGHARAYNEVDFDAHASTDGGTASYSSRNSNSNGYANSHAESDGGANTDGDSDAYTYCDTDACADADTHSHSCSDSAANAGTGEPGGGADVALDCGRGLGAGRKCRGGAEGDIHVSSGDSGGIT